MRNKINKINFYRIKDFSLLKNCHIFNSEKTLRRLLGKEKRLIESLTQNNRKELFLAV